MDWISISDEIFRIRYEFSSMMNDGEAQVYVYGLVAHDDFNGMSGMIYEGDAQWLVMVGDESSRPQRRGR